MEPNTLPNQPAPEVPQPTPVVTPVQQPVIQPQQPVLPTQPVFQSNPTVESPKMDKRFLTGGIFVLLIISGLLVYYGGSYINQSFIHGDSTTVTKDSSQNAKFVQAWANAEDVRSFVANYADKNTYYPASVAEITSKSTTRVKVLADADVSPINADNGLDYVAWACLKTCVNTTGGRITYWDYKTNAVSTNVLYVGDANVSSTFVNPEP